MATAESGQNREGYGVLIGFLSLVGLTAGILYLWLFQRPLREALYILPLAVLGTVLIFALFILIIHYLQNS